MDGSAGNLKFGGKQYKERKVVAPAEQNTLHQSLPVKRMQAMVEQEDPNALDEEELDDDFLLYSTKEKRYNTESELFEQNGNNPTRRMLNQKDDPACCAIFWALSTRDK